jgi:hypothetical protein
VTDEELELRHRIMRAFAETGEPPPLAGEDPAVVQALEKAHVIVLGDDGGVRMAHPFAGHDEGATVESGARRWRGNCAWDGFGIAAALNLADFTVTSNGIRAEDTTLFHVEVPAARWWDDVGYT